MTKTTGFHDERHRRQRDRHANWGSENTPNAACSGATAATRAKQSKVNVMGVAGDDGARQASRTTDKQNQGVVGDLPAEFRAAGLIVAPSAPLGCAEYMRAATGRPTTPRGLLRNDVVFFFFFSL